MQALSRRSLLRSGAALGGMAIAGRLGIRQSRAEDTVLRLYNGQHAQTTNALIDAFIEATGIEVDVRSGSGSQLANQIIEEGDASPADIFYAEESPPVAALANHGLLSSIDPETLKQIPARFSAKDGTWIGASIRCRVVAFNKEQITENELPASVLDFATAAWDGKVAFSPTSGAFQAQIVAIEQMKGRDAAVNWLKGLKAYGRSYNTNTAAMMAVEKGDIPVALINNYYWYSVAAEVGEANMKSALHYIGHKDPGALIMVSAAAILKSSKKQDAAQKFLAFMVSEAGQKAITDVVAEYPVRPGVQSPYPLKPFSEIQPPDVTADDLGDVADALVLAREAGLA
jgi:iron(III) transport system substrate-binding protein